MRVAAAETSEAQAERFVAWYPVDDGRQVAITAQLPSADGAVVWSETYGSAFSAGDLGGATRTLNANEGAVRENLKAFVQGVRERWRP